MPLESLTEKEALINYYRSIIPVLQKEVDDFDREVAKAMLKTMKSNNPIYQETEAASKV